MTMCGRIDTSRKLQRSIVAAIVATHVILSAWGAFVHSPTADEPAYLASGISHWKLGNFDLCQVSPPLVRLAASIPVMLAQPEYDWSAYQTGHGVRAEHQVGQSFLIKNGERSFWLFTLGRWGCLPFSILGAWVMYSWADELFGRISAYAGLVLWCFSPNILAHSQLLTPDIGVSSLCFASCYAFYKWSKNSTWLGAFIFGAAVGLAVLAKTNGVVLFVVLPLGFLVQLIAKRQKPTMPTSLQLILGFWVALYTVNLGYSFEGSGRPLGDYQFVSDTFTGAGELNRFRGSLIEDLPVPLPSAFLEGIDLQRRDFENSTGKRKTYFRGNWYDKGWWWYYLYVICVKVPEGTLLLTLMGSVAISKARGENRLLAVSCIALPAIALFALPCSQTGFGHSLRYILPTFPFFFLIGTAAFSGGKGQQLICGLLLSWTVLSSFICFPHSLSYFNRLSGGYMNGHAHLLDGNVDWGQDLLYVQDWLTRNTEKSPVYVAVWNYLPDESLGIHFKEPRFSSADDPLPGWYVISVNFLRGEYRQRRPHLERFLKRKVEAKITPAIYVYHIE